ncbi:MAG: fimbrillin family protein [Dysgonamonadaceae bacterium]|nr:fimbrillin family protein [Dysgonamonadaceae bacterium]
MKTTTKYFGKQSHWLALSLLSLVALVSCDNGTPVPDGWVSMKIDFRGMETEASEELRSASSGIISSQRIVLPSGQEWQVDLSVDPESPLRAGPLPSNSYIRLLAMDGSGNLVRYVDWQQGVGTVPDLYIPDTYSSCDFVCYSYKNTTNTLPSGYTEGSSLPALSVRDGSSNELLLWRASGVTVSNGGSVGPVTLTRQLTQVKLELISPEKLIEGVSNTITLGSAIPVNHTTAYDFSAGAPVTDASSYSSTDLPFTWSTDISSGVSTATSDPLILIPQTGFTLTIPAGAISMETGVSQQTAISIPFSNALEAGKIHTIRVQLVKGFARFASSNIYWDGSKLTFDTYSSSPSLISQQKQGVLFKWGSLIGLSAPGKDQVQAYEWSNDSTIYVPLNPGSPTTDHTSWEQTTTTSAQSRWSGTSYFEIPYVTSDDYTGPSNDRTNNYLTTTYHSSASTAAYKGDICKYINGAYRMPRSEEFYSAGYWSGQANILAYNVNGNHPSSDIDGTTQLANSGSVNRGITLTIATTGIDGLFFPASGWRNRYGHLYYVSTLGSYWSSTANLTYACTIYFSRGSLTPMNGPSRSESFSVRCVLQ